MDLEWELFRARAAESKAKGPLPPPPPPVLPQVVTTSMRVEELEEPKPKRIRTPFLAALKNNRLSRSLDMLPVEDLHATTATAQAKSKPSKQKSSTPEPGESSSSISPDSTPETTRRSGRKGARKDTKPKPSQPVSPRTSYDMFKRFGRKKDKAPDTASSSPPKTLAPPPDRFHNSQFKPGSLDEGEQRNTSSWGRAWGRSAERRKDSGSEQPTAGNPHHFVIPHDLMRRTLDRLPADVYFTPLDEGEPPGDDTAAPCYMEGPDDSEAEVALPYSAGGCSGSHSRDSDAIGESGEERDLGRDGTVRACGQSVSTYPRVLVMPGTRLGDPVCDCFALRLYRNGAIFCVCDGCGWGRAAVDAARSVRAVFMQSLHQHSLIVKQSSRRELKPTSQTSAERSSTGLDVDDPLRGRSRSDASGSAKGKGKVRRGAHRVMEMMGVGANNNGEDSKRSIRQAAECLMQLVAKAHNNIISGKEAWECGTTTVCAGLVVDLDLNAPNSPLTADDPVISKRSALLFTTDKRPTKHTSPRRNSDADGGPDSRKRRRKGLLVVSIGDCKVYLYSHASGTIKDLTEGNRQNATSVNDCGGRLGPASGMESTEPDLRNLDLYFAECDEGDCVWAVSDGVHDNFDPQMLGLMPHDLDEQQESVTWDDLAPETAARLKNEFAVRALEHELLSPPPPLLPSPARSPPPQTQQGDEQLRPSLSTVTQMMQEPSSTQIFYEMMSRGQRNRATAPAVVLSDHGRDNYLAIPDVSAPETEGEVVDDASGCPQDPAPALPELSRLAISGSAKRPATDGERAAGRRPIVLSPVDVTRKLISLCVEQTLHTRNFMEQNPEKRQPCDYRAFPGKLDHTTCLAFHT